MFVIHLLGSFRLTHRGEPVALPLSAQRLAALLALERRPMLRRTAAGVLWPDKTDARAAANLRSSLWRLNNCVTGLVAGNCGSIALSGGVSLDIDQFLPDDLGDASPTSVSASTAAIVSDPPNQTELLVDWSDEWVIAERERVRQLTLRALERAAFELCSKGLYAEALEAGATAVKLAPLRETAHRAVMEVHLTEGNYGEAVRQYDAFTSLSFDAFGVGPSDNLSALFSRFGARI